LTDSHTKTCRELADYASVKGRGDLVSLECFVQAVAKFIAERTSIEVDHIYPEFDFLRAGVLDSILMIELFLFIDTHFADGIVGDEIVVAELSTPARLYERYRNARSRRNDP